MHMFIVMIIVKIFCFNAILFSNKVMKVFVSQKTLIEFKETIYFYSYLNMLQEISYKKVVNHSLLNQSFQHHLSNQ
jgi:hypothetical protein